MFGRLVTFRKNSAVLDSCLRVLFLLTLISVSSFPVKSKASVFDPTYANPVFNCTTGTGCCLQVAQLVKDMFTGSGLYPYPPNQNLQQYYYMNVLWPKIEKALQDMSDEFRNAITFQTVAFGAMIDTQTLNQTLLSLQKQTSETLLNETPSEQICRFGTLSRSLANSEEKSRVTQIGLSKAMMDRQLMQKNTASAFAKEEGSKLGRTSDKASRFAQLRDVFCNPSDAGGALGDGWCTATTDTRYNRDIDIDRSLLHPLTLDVDFATPAKTADEENIMALANNLYAHDLPINIGISDFKTPAASGGDKLESFQNKILDYRSLVAKRSIAQNSYTALASMRAESSTSAAQYIKEMAGYLGLDAAGQNAFAGQKPSYYAQMEFLTRTIYQSPTFYANLMESGANIARQQTAMEGIGLMQDRDIYESLRRSEIVLSTLLETYVVQEADRLKDRGIK